MTTRSPSVAGIDPDVIEQAAEWIARLWSETATERDVAACAAWRAQHPDHERAWRGLQMFGDRLDSLPRPLARNALLNAPARSAIRRRRALQLFGGCVLAGISSLWLRDTRQWHAVAADVSNGIGVAGETVLPDGSQVTLDTASAIDLRFTADERRIVLRSGAVLVNALPDLKAAGRPLLVETAQGSLRALGARFSVRSVDELTEVVVADGAVEVTPRTGGVGRRLVAGQQLRFSRQQWHAVHPVTEHALAWSRGQLVAERMRLSGFVTELGRYRHGVVRCSDEVADLRVTGIFSLRDTDRTLVNLTQGLPVDLRWHTRYWVTLVPRGAGGSGGAV